MVSLGKKKLNWKKTDGVNKREMKEKIKEKSHLKESYAKFETAYRAIPNIFSKASWFSEQIYFLVFAELVWISNPHAPTYGWAHFEAPWLLMASRASPGSQQPPKPRRSSKER